MDTAIFSWNALRGRRWLWVVEQQQGSSSASSGSAQRWSGTSNNTLRIAYQANIASFDPDNSFEVAGLGAIRAVYQGLVTYAPNSTKLIGLLAKTWTISSDGKTYTFHLHTRCQVPRRYDDDLEERGSFLQAEDEPKAHPVVLPRSALSR